jgi:phosphoribosylaminoimidazole-succinocarboxamide synthase
MAAVLRTELPDYPVKRGKVRDVYDLGDRLALVATDRISAFDWVMPNAIPGKGELLTRMSRFWFEWLGMPNHLISDRLEDLPAPFQAQAELFRGRTMLVQKTEVIPIECVARGYLAGSGWKEYQATGRVCELPLPPGLREADHLPEPIFTPTTKAETGHDATISYAEVVQLVGASTATLLRDRTLEVYRRGAEYARQRGVILADTKLEWGRRADGELILIDEVFTPDSSRFWPAADYHPGTSPPSWDKQYLRDWLEASGWDKNSPPPPLPAEVVAATAARYAEALERLTAHPTLGCHP